jgi:putative membrane-bound dehydrogenase-like protein
MRHIANVSLFFCILVTTSVHAADANRLAYLDELNPYYPHRNFPKLVTPQWVGEEGVEAVVVLAIDDMRDHAKYEQFLRPILDRLKQIDGRAPVSIMTNVINHQEPHLQRWLKEGVNLDTHTIDHPCPLLAGGNFAKAKSTYDRCVDLMFAIPNNKPVAFRMPCCDSKNTPSPRFYAEIFNQRTERGHFLTIDSSVFNITTPNDPDLSRDLVIDADGRAKFKKYVPFESFVNTIEDYPYPYVIGNLIWQFPCATPSDWQAQNLHKPDNPDTVRDWKAQLDVTVIKQGVFNFVFHPHNWIKPEQMVEFIDYAVQKHGKKVKFLTFAECQERLNKHLLAGKPIRDAKGNDSGVRIFDANDDGYMDVGRITADKRVRATRIWDPNRRAWTEDVSLPEQVVARDVPLPPGVVISDDHGRDAGARFIDLDEDGDLDIVFSNDDRFSVHLFESLEKGWRQVRAGKRGDPDEIPPIVKNGQNNGAWFHSRHLWVQNEHTAAMKDHVDRRSFSQLLGETQPTAKSPQASLNSIKIRPGFTVQQVAAEPLVLDPIAFDWGPDGKLWVVEMGDYPSGTDGKGQPGGVVRYLEDTDGDGLYDKSTVFLDNLNFPTGVIAWRNGILVTAAPDIFYAEDTDADGKADKRDVLFTGFTEGNQQHRINGLWRGLDNWLYGANGHSGGKVKSLKTGKVTNISGRDFRIRPDEGIIETTTGQSQFGRTQDDFGNWFGCENPNPIYHFVLDDRYLRRNPNYAPPQTIFESSPQYPEVFPISPQVERFNDFHTQNRITSACGITIYRDDLFGPHFAGNAFTCEPVHNLILRSVLKPVGVTFKAERFIDEQNVEFLASSDNWSRPTMVRAGPDGALWYADMYRHVIEHPEWIPRAWQDRLDLRAGHDMGRIYRVYPIGATPRAIPRLGALDTPALVATLNSPSGWQRDFAQQLLIHRADPAAVPLLKQALTDSDNPLFRLHALCTLNGLKALDEDTLLTGLQDKHPGVRRHAIRLSEPLLNQSANLTTTLTRLVIDDDLHVRMQLAYSLGEWHAPNAGRALGEIAAASSEDPFILAAVMTSLTADNLEPMAKTLLASNRPLDTLLVSDLLRQSIAFKRPTVTATLLDRITAPANGDTFAEWQLGTLATLLDALDRTGGSLKSLANADEPLKSSVARLGQLFSAARALASNESAPAHWRRLAIDLLARGFDHRDDDLKTLSSLLSPQTPDQLQSAAITSIARQRDPAAAKLLLNRWKRLTPARRDQVIDAMLGRESWTKLLLDSVENESIRPTDIDATRRQRLLFHQSRTISDRATTLFAQTINPDRDKLIDQFRPALSLEGDPQKGATTFTNVCATCHKLNDVGHPVGPDLAALGNQSAESLLIAILDPNRAVQANYADYLAETRDGRTVNGILVEETATSVTILAANAERHQILRSDLKVLRSTGLSLMPEGLESNLTPQDLADLLAHVRSGAAPRKPKEFVGNTPQLLRASPADGALRLPASAAEIYGPTLQFEAHWGNLGYWQSEADEAVWTMQVDKSGNYTVSLEYSCAANSVGNTITLTVADQTVTHRVQSTGTWDDYKKFKIGDLRLPAGQVKLTAAAPAPIKGAALDLRSVELVP